MEEMVSQAQATIVGNSGQQNLLLETIQHQWNTMDRNKTFNKTDSFGSTNRPLTVKWSSGNLVIKQLMDLWMRLEKIRFTTRYFASTAVFYKDANRFHLHLELAGAPIEPGDHSDEAGWMRKAADTCTSTVRSQFVPTAARLAERCRYYTYTTSLIWSHESK